MKSVLFAVLGAVVLALSLPGCSSSATPAASADADEIDAVPFKSTVMLAASDLTNLAPDKGDGVLAFAGAPAALDAVKRGSVLVSSVSPSTPSGLLRIVKTVTRDGSKLTLETLNAPIQIAFERLHMKIQPRSTGSLGALMGTTNDVTPRSLHPQGGGVSGPTASANASVNVDIFLFDGDGDPMTKDDQVEMKGSIDGTVTVGFTLDFDWGLADNALSDAAVTCLESILLGPEVCLLALIPEAKVTLAADARLDAKVTLEGAAIADFKKDFDLLDVTLDPIALYPVPIIPVVTVTAGIEGGASAGFSTGVHLGVDVTSGVTMSSKHLDSPSYEPPTVSNVTFGADPPAVTLQASLKASLGAQASILIAGVTGPFAAADVYAKLGADLTKNPCWGLDAGVESYLGLTIKPTLPIIGSITLFDWKASPFSTSWPVLNGACSIPASTSTLPPGSGADGSHYAKPTFTPWSRLVSSPADGSFASSPTGDDLDWTDLTRTIDGRYFVTGSHVTEPLKLDATSASVTWSRRYHDGDASAPLLTVRRSLQQEDTSITMLTSGADVASFGLLDIGQGGGVYGYQTINLGDAKCNPTPKSLASDGAGGVYVAGACDDERRGFAAHVAADGSLLFALSLADAAGGTVIPTAIVGVGGEVVVTGELRPPSGDDQMFAVRLDATGARKFANAYQGCAGAMDVSPTAGIANSNGDVTLVGSASAHHVGFLGRVRTDGSVAFASFPGLNLGLSKVFVINSVAELPTTGYVVAGSTVDVTGSAPTDTAGTALVGLDAIGHTRWSKRFTLLEGGTPVPSGFPGLRLSDDGGAVVAAVAQGAGGTGGRLWAFEAVAKDGTLMGLDPSKAQSDDLGITDVMCTLTASPWKPSLAALPATSTPHVAAADVVKLSVAPITR